MNSAFTPVLDRMLGTAWDDYPALHARAIREAGPTLMGERAMARAAESAPPALASRAPGP